MVALKFAEEQHHRELLLQEKLNSSFLPIQETYSLNFYMFISMNMMHYYNAIKHYSPFHSKTNT